LFCRPPSAFVGAARLLAAQSPPAAGAHLFDSGFGSIWLLSTPIVSDGVTRLVERYPPLNLQLAADARRL